MSLIESTETGVQTMWATLPRPVAWLMVTLGPFFVGEPFQSAYTPVFAATSPFVKFRRKEFAGAFLMPIGIISDDKVSASAKDAVAARELWATSERAVAAM